MKFSLIIFYIQRADFHRLLLDLASTVSTLRLNSTVVKVNPSPPHPSVTLSTGEVLSADLIIGCDGVKSLVRDLVVGEPTKAVATGDAAYRAIIPTSELMKDPALKELVENPEMTGWMGPGRHIMGYCIVCCYSSRSLAPLSLNAFICTSARNGNTISSWRILMMVLSSLGPQKAAPTRCALTSTVGNQGNSLESYFGRDSSFN